MMLPEASPASGGGLDDFRIAAPREIAALLKSLSDAAIPLNLNATDGSVVSCRLWTVDPPRGAISFSADADDPKLDAVLACNEATVVGYYDSIKLQFDVHGLVLVRNGKTCALSGAFPRELFRFQRRNAYRVRPLLRATPTATLRHPQIADMSLALRVLDLSIGGCALFLPNDVPTLQPGVLLNRVQLELDTDTRLTLDLRLQHVMAMQPDTQGVRLGCEFVDAPGEALRDLQRYIDQTQKRRKLMALD